MDYFETITLARQFLPIKMRVLRKGFHNFVRRVQREAAAAASVRQRRRGRGHRRLPDHESEAIVEALPLYQVLPAGDFLWRVQSPLG